MEENRLKQMPENYDREVFNRLYKKTEPLRRKLAGQIQSSRLGVDYEEILSMFDIKFIYVFSKYQDKFNEDILLGHLIRALQLYKCRILRTIYSKKNEMFTKMVDVDEIQDYGNIFIDKPIMTDEATEFLDLALSYLKKSLTPDAYHFLEFELNPPDYVLNRLPEKTKKIPNELIIGYFDLESEDDSYIEHLRDQIKKGIKQAKHYFNSQDISYIL